MQMPYAEKAYVARYKTCSDASPATSSAVTYIAAKIATMKMNESFKPTVQLASIAFHMRNAEENATRELLGYK